MIELTEEQRKALANTAEAPLRVLDSTTNTAYVLVRADVYERIFKDLDDDGLDMRQVAVLVEKAMQEDDAGDPTLEFYQQKYSRKS